MNFQFKTTIQSLLFALILSLVGCTSNEKEKKDIVDWIYNQIDYPMTESKAIEAELPSSTRLDLQGLYNINYSPKFTFNIRQIFPDFIESARDLDVFYLTKNEEFIISIMCEDCPMLREGKQRLKYIIDDKRPQTYYGTEIISEGGGITRYRFQVDSRSFIEELIKSNTLRLEMSFVSHGTKIIDFNVKGLKPFKSFLSNNGLTSSQTSPLNSIEDKYKVKDTWIGDWPSYEMKNPIYGIEVEGLETAVIEQEYILIPATKRKFEFLSNNIVYMEVVPADTSFKSYKLEGLYNGERWDYFEARFDNGIGTESYTISNSTAIFDDTNILVNRLKVKSGYESPYNYIYRESNESIKNSEIDIKSSDIKENTIEMIEVVEDDEYPISRAIDNPDATDEDLIVNQENIE